MQVIDVPIEAIDMPDWNPNGMDLVMHSRLRRSLEPSALAVGRKLGEIGQDQEVDFSSEKQ